MKATELIVELDKLVRQHGDKDVLITDSETGWCDTVGDVRLIVKNEYQPQEGFLLNVSPI